jgi:hypothetical protein
VVRIELQLAETAGWRALLTLAQQGAQTFLSEALEEYVVALLFRSLGSAANGTGMRTARFARQLVAGTQANSQDLVSVGDHCLLFAGLFPEHAIRQRIPVTYFVHVGQQAFRDYAARIEGAERDLYRELATHYVRILDVFLTMREATEEGPFLDGLNAYQLWREAGSVHGWQVLRQLTPALPASATFALH